MPEHQEQHPSTGASRNDNGFTRDTQANVTTPRNITLWQDAELREATPNFEPHGRRLRLAGAVAGSSTVGVNPVPMSWGEPMQWPSPTTKTVSDVCLHPFIEQLARAARSMAPGAGSQLSQERVKAVSRGLAVRAACLGRTGANFPLSHFFD